MSTKAYFPQTETKSIFKLEDRVEYFNPQKQEYLYGKIVDKLTPYRKPDLFIVQKWKLFKMPLNPSKFPRWVVQIDSTGHCIVFPDDPQRVIFNRIYLKGDVTITRLTPRPEPRVKPDHQTMPYML